MGGNAERSVVFHVACSIQNFRIKVEVDFLGAGLAASRAGTSYPARTPTFRTRESHSLAQFDCKTVKWQQKIEHPLRQKPQITVSPPENAPDQKTSEIANEEPTLPPETSRIFTRVDSELQALQLSEASAELPPRRGRQRKVVPVSRNALKNPVANLPTDQKRLTHRNVPHHEQHMHILGYFGPLTRTSEEIDAADEYLLCKITVVNQHTIIFSPDLGTRKIDTRYGIYRVNLEVPEMDNFDSIPDDRTDKFEEAKAEEDESTTTFELPGDKRTWINYFLSIEQAVDFPHDGLSVEYKLELPSSVSLVDGSSAGYGRTQRCFKRYDVEGEICRFSFPLEFVLEFPEELTSLESDSSLLWPHLLFRVTAEDYWQRFHVDGYAQLSLPTATGQHRLNVHCWRPVNPINNLALMRDYFLGQAIDLTSLEAVGIRSGSTGKSHSNVGLCAERSGQLTFSVQVMRQTRQTMSKAVLRSLQYGSMLSKIGLSGNLHWRIMSVLMQFEDARKQLLRLRAQKLPDIQHA